MTGFEPAVSSSTGRRFSQLSYTHHIRCLLMSICLAANEALTDSACLRKIRRTLGHNPLTLDNVPSWSRKLHPPCVICASQAFRCLLEGSLPYYTTIGLVGVVRLELTTSASQTQHSSHLSYTPMSLSGYKPLKDRSILPFHG